MSGYLATWIQYEKEAQAVRDQFPDCEHRVGCPAGEHMADCPQYRRNHYRRRIAQAMRAAIGETPE